MFKQTKVLKGLFYRRVRDESRLTLHASETLYNSSIAFGVRQVRSIAFGVRQVRSIAFGVRQVRSIDFGVRQVRSIDFGVRQVRSICKHFSALESTDHAIWSICAPGPSGAFH